MASVSEKVRSSLASATDQILVVWSWLTETSFVPSGVNETPFTLALCPTKGRRVLPSADQISSRPPCIATAIHFPSALTANPTGTASVETERKRAPAGIVQNFTRLSCPALISVLPSGKKLRLA